LSMGASAMPETAHGSLARSRSVACDLRSAARVLVALACAVIAAAAPPLRAATHCVQNAGDLQNALNAASNGGANQNEDNTIHVGAGTFTTSGAPFNFGTTNGVALIIDGGWNSNCAVQNLTPGATVLDGGNLTRVLTLQTNDTVSVSQVTISHAFY